jgi:hypothetical protein
MLVRALSDAVMLTKKRATTGTGVMVASAPLETCGRPPRPWRRFIPGGNC